MTGSWALQAAGEAAAGGGLLPWSSLLFALAVIGEALAVVFVYRVLVRGGSPASTLLWVVVILLTPWLGLLLYYLLPRRLQLRRLRRVRARGQRLRMSRGDYAEVGLEVGGAAAFDAGESIDEVGGTTTRSSPPNVAGDGLEWLLEKAGAITDGSALRWLSGGEQFYAVAVEAIAAAEQHVHCVVYILRPDATGLRFLEVLTEAAGRGVTVRLCYDSFGSFGLKAQHLEPLRRAGGRAEAFLPMLWKRRPFTVNLRNHRKLLVVDGRVGFVGGRNVGDEYRTDRLGQTRHWYDAMLELRGPAVERLQDVFAQDWCTATDEVLADLGPPPEAVAGGERVAIVCSGPDLEHSTLWFALVQALGDARHSVTLSSPYLVLPPTLLFALQLAAARGVSVSVRTNGQSAEAAILYHAQRHHYRRLLDSGIDVFETRHHYNHAKFLVVDERVVFVGSNNMDLRSAHLNFEVAAVALDARELAAQVLATVRERDADFRRVTEADLPTDPLRRAIDGLCGLFSPLL